MKKFDFEHPDFGKQCPAKQAYIKNFHDIAVTEEDFVTAVQAMPKHIHWSWGHSPSKARSQYKHLVEDFGLFPGGQNED